MTSTNVRRLAVIVASQVVFAACAATPRYVVTAEPIELAPSGVRLCIAVEPQSSGGIWWWRPGRDGRCTSRTTGPAPFAADQASVSVDADRTAAVRFSVDLIPSGTAEAVLTLTADDAFVLPDGRRIDGVRRADLEIPESR